MTKELERYQKALGVAVEALRFYANCETYHAVAFMFDRPSGDFAEDFSTSKEYGRAMPGRTARKALSKLERSYGSLTTINAEER